MKTKEMSAQRSFMVDRQIVARGVRDPLVLAAMRSVPREQFLPETMRDLAYEDAPLAIGEEQTISQPYIVAYMIESLGLKGGEVVLDIGTGSGYAAAIVAQIASEVYSVERIEKLAESALNRLRALGYQNVHVLNADGTQGWSEHAPYDAIMVAACGCEVPESLKSQLVIGGRLVMPVQKGLLDQVLIRVTRKSRLDYETEQLVAVRFVPLVED